MDGKFISKGEAAEILGLSTSTIERIILDGELPVYKFRGQCRINREDLDTYISRCRRHPAATVPVARTRTSAARRGSKLVSCEYYPGMKVV